MSDRLLERVPAEVLILRPAPDDKRETRRPRASTATSEVRSGTHCVLDDQEAADMGNLTGSSTAEIDAPIGRVWELVEDVEAAPSWQGGLKSVRAIERDNDGRAVLCESESDAKVRTIKSVVRFSYNGPGELRWTQEKGEMKSVDGSWTLEDLGSDRTRATYAIDVDLGRMLGMVIRGPLVDLLRGQLAGARAGELKKHAEG